MGARSLPTSIAGSRQGSEVGHTKAYWRVRRKEVRSSLFRCSQGYQQRLELFVALRARLKVLPDQRHGLGSAQAGELHLYEAVYLLEALIAADLFLTGLG